MLSAEQIKENYDRFVGLIDSEFQGNRRDKLLKLYTDFEERVAFAPASNKVFYHSCFPGGYIHHVLNVYDISKEMDALFEKFGVSKDYSKEELSFSVINHDLGKIGDEKYPYYIETKEDWKIRRGQMYDFHPKAHYMQTQDRSLYLLNRYGISMSQIEYITILTHDGLYSESNKKYYQTFYPETQMKTSLPHLVHLSDMVALRSEYDAWRFSENDVSVSNLSPKNSRKKKLEQIGESNQAASEDIMRTFDEIFTNKKGSDD